MKKSQLSFLIFLVFVVGLYVFQNKAVTPFLLKMVKSPMLVKETDDFRQPGAVDTEKTRMALVHCNTYLKENFDLGESTELSKKEHSAWALGAYTYVIQSEFDVLSPSDIQEDKKYICKIKYFGGNETDYDNWKVSGFDFD